MPALPFSQALTASQLGANPLTNWQYEVVPAAYTRGAYCRLLARATTINTRLTLYSGSQTIVQRAPIQGAGVAGTTPAPQTTPVIEWIAQPGDRLMPLIDEVGGAVATVDGILYVDPL